MSSRGHDASARLCGVLLFCALAWNHCLSGDSQEQEGPAAPDGLMIDLIRRPETTRIDRAAPCFSWMVNDPRRGAVQSAWRVVVRVAEGERVWWDSGRVDGPSSVAVPYSGPPLEPRTSYRWQVMTWDAAGRASDWSAPQVFHTADSVRTDVVLAVPDLANTDFTNRPALVGHVQSAREALQIDAGRWFFDFGRAAFGNLAIDWPDAPQTELLVSLGEKLAKPRVLDDTPPGAVRYQQHRLVLAPGRRWHQPSLSWAPPGWMREGFLGLPPEFGQVMPFRYALIETQLEAFEPGRVYRRWLSVPFDDEAARFVSSRPGLDQVWELCRYTIQATSFLGVYVDGERERKPYEGDAFINQLAHYNVDRSYATARHTHEYLLQRPTWPLEWQMHSVLIAWEDYLHTGDRRSLEACYDRLAVKTLVGLARPDGLIDASRQTPELRSALALTEPMRIVIDWPPGERDGHRITPVDAVANAFHYRALELMRRIAQALDRRPEAEQWRLRARRVRAAHQEVFFDAHEGLYRDGEGVKHSSLHANLFPLAFGLVPEAHQDRVLDWVESRGMAGSVYAAHYLLEVLFRYGRAQAAQDLIDSRGLRSWHNMLAKGSTMTMEAWDQEFKPNQDWNHAWACAPAAAIGRYLAGVRPLEPGARRIIVAPQPGALEAFTARVPTIRGPVDLRWQREGGQVALHLRIPANTTAEVHLPAGDPAGITEGGAPLSSAPGIARLERNGASEVLLVGGGEYRFRFTRS